MLTDSHIVLYKAAPPRSFAGLMSLYESNYIRLTWLVDDLDSIQGSIVSSTIGDCDLHMSLRERARYTTTVHLTYYFSEPAEEYLAVADPDLRLRIYHDARLAEVLDCCATHKHEALRRFQVEGGTELDRRWRRNVMLNKWLEYCADRGHRFEFADR